VVDRAAMGSRSGAPGSERATPRVRAVVLNYNGGQLVERCVDALLRTEWPDGAFEVVVVDNDSHDGSDAAIAERFPQVRVLSSGANLGFPANNLAMTDLDDVDFLALVNNDAFVEPGWLEPLVETLQADPSLGAACPKILFDRGFVDLLIETDGFTPTGGDTRELGVRISGIEVDGVDQWRAAQFVDGFHAIEHGPGDEATFRWTAPRASLRVPVAAQVPAAATARVRLAGPEGASLRLAVGDAEIKGTVTAQPQWFEIDLAGEPYDVVNNAGSLLVEGGYGADRGFLQRDTGAYDEPADVFAWCGAGVLFPKRYLRHVGVFEPAFFMYYEDTDLSWRGRAQGWRYRYVPESVLRHVHAATSVEGSDLFQHFVERNRLYLLTRNAPARLAFEAIVRYKLTTASYARRDIVRPVLGGHRPSFGLVRRRVRSFLAFLRLLPRALVERRGLRRRQIVRDDELMAWAVPQP
jgi:GT2 family glycosyltransferase